MKMAREEETVTEPELPKRKPGSAWLTHALVIFSLLLLNFLLYARTVPIGFLSVDDPDYVQNNPWIEKLNKPNLKHILTTPYQANYAPANLLSYALDVAMAGGKKAAAIHISNVLWHGWVIFTVYLLAFTLRGEIVTATAAALLFLLHPAHVEVVAWVSSRKDLVATGFAALSMTFYLLWRRQARHNAGWYGACLGAFLIASAAKQSVILLPALMLVWDVFVEKRIRWMILFEKLPFGLITWFFGWMTWHAQPSTNQTWHPFVLAATELTNLRLLVGVGDFVMYRPAPDPATVAASMRTGWIILAGLVWVVPLLLFARRQPVRLFLSAWILIHMIPAMLLNFVVPITDRYLFLLSVGACILLADLAAALATRLPRVWPLALAALLVLAGWWAMKTYAYIQEWADPRSVWHGAQLKTSSPQVAQFLGEIFQNAGDRVAGFVKTGTGFDSAKELPLARSLLGQEEAERLRSEWAAANQPRTNSISYRDKLWVLAWEQYKNAAANRGALSMPNLFMNRGRLLVSQGKFSEAIPEFQTALAFAERSSYSVIRQETTTHALRAISVAYWNMRKFEDALEWMVKAREVQRKSGKVWVPTLDQEIEKLKALKSEK